MTDELGTDAQKWAEAFMQSRRSSPVVLDEATMISWFANAIMAGYDEARRKYETVNLHDHSMATIRALPEVTQPEPININELKRLLVEVVADILDLKDRTMSPDEYARWKKRLVRQIENSILNGDDS